jgi:hypothetical protein
MYSPALNTFYVQSGDPTFYRYFDGTSITGGANVTVGAATNYKAGISHNGYPLIAVNTGGTNFDLREYTSADLSSATNFGAISGLVYSRSAQSTFKWLPNNNKYIHCSWVSTSTIGVYTATSGSPQAYTNIVNTNIAGTTSINTSGIAEIDNDIYIFGIATYSGKTPYVSTYSIKSSDGGYTWANTTIPILGITKNFT